MKKEYPVRALEKIIILRPSSISTGAVRLALEAGVDIVYSLHGWPHGWPCVAWDLVQAFLQAKYSQESRHLRRLAKVASAESEGRGSFRAAESSRRV
jgi:CRISPR/Cas system-associated endonuclease Cas1